MAVISKRTALLALCWMCAVGGFLLAQTVGTQPTGDLSAAYVLGSGDEISIRVLDVDEIDGKPTRIDLGGYIDVPLIGKFKAAGLSINQLESDLAVHLKRYVRQPRVTVTVMEYRSQPVSVLGAVNTPGVYNLAGRSTLMELLSRAGGLRTDAGNNIKITRRTEWGSIPLPSAKRDTSGEFSTAEVSAKSLLDTDRVQDNIMICPKDVISVPKAELVYVVGAVRRPGGLVLNERENISVLQALSLAEGLDKMSAPKQAKIVRRNMMAGKEEIPVNISRILSGKAPDIPLVANDILFIPTSGAKAAAFRAIEAAIQTGTGVAIFRR